MHPAHPHPHDPPGAMPPPAAFGVREGLSYGLLGLPLAFVALPLYVHLPHHYATAFGMPLATLGLVLMLTRLLDAFTDPWLGRLSDRLLGRSPRAVLQLGAVAAAMLMLGMAGLFTPPVRHPAGLIVWAAGGLLLTYTAFSLLTIAHQSWGARLGGNEVYRARVVAWRESAGLVGVVLASVLPTLLGWDAWLLLFGLTLALGWLAWTRAPRPLSRPVLPGSGWAALWRPWLRRPFRRLMGVFVLSGLGSAIPATLVLFFVQDRLAAAQYGPLFLATYFVCAAASIPLWLRAVRTIGLARSWLAGMVLAVSVFGWTATLGTGDVGAFLLLCALSGLALGADLALPAALLAGVIATQSDSDPREGSYFGWWNLASKLNLALAAGLALPLLDLLGYQPGQQTPHGLLALSWAYAVVPCLLKLAAAGCLYTLIIRPPDLPTPPPQELS